MTYHQSGKLEISELGNVETIRVCVVQGTGTWMTGIDWWPQCETEVRNLDVCVGHLDVEAVERVKFAVRTIRRSE